MGYFTMQSLRQQGQWDCGVEVFGKLAGISREELLRELPEAANGITVSRWEQWLTEKGFQVKRLGRDEEYTLPCAHLIKRLPHHHWIYEDGTGIHDPDPKLAIVSPKLIQESFPSYYREGKELTISLIGPT